MAALAAAMIMRQKEELAALERSAKQGSRVRLLADRSISAAALQGVLGEYLRHQGSKDLWCFIAPPPTGPTQYGWHTYPHPEWLAKTAPLLYDLVGVAPNTKLQSSKLVISLKALLESNELELKVKKDRTIQDSLDQLDLTIRILLNMTRSLKCSELQRLKCQRCLSRLDWMKVELLLERVQLPPELLAAASFSSVEEEDVPLQTVVSPATWTFLEETKLRSRWLVSQAWCQMGQLCSRSREDLLPPGCVLCLRFSRGSKISRTRSLTQSLLAKRRLRLRRKMNCRPLTSLGKCLSRKRRTSWSWWLPVNGQSKMQPDLGMDHSAEPCC